MSSEELKPCPFCGGDVSFHKDEECDGCHFIQCGQCRAFFDFATGADPGNDYTSVDALRAAIAPMWNTRAQLAAIQGGMGEVVEVVAWQDAENPLYTTAERRVMHEWAGNQYPIVELMTVAQHNRILAASVPAGCKVVPVDLIERTICRLTHGHEHDKAVRELRALLVSAEGSLPGAAS